MKKSSMVWPAALILIGLGLFVLPIHLREALLNDVTGGYASINWIMVFTVLLLTAAGWKNYSREDALFCVIWLLLWGLVIATKWGDSLRGHLRVIGNSLLPVFLWVQRMDPRNRKKWLGRALICFDIFIIILLICGLVEKRMDGGLLGSIVAWFEAHGIKCGEYNRYMGLHAVEKFRFHFLWGHTLTNALMFNCFFILNDIYHRNAKRRYPKLVFFAISLTGVLLCSSKTAIVALCAYLVVSNWNQKRWLLLYAGAGAGMYAAGLFQRIIGRFLNTSLTSGRVDALKEYFALGKYPLRIFPGYGTFTAYRKPLNPLRAGFEFPVLMFALDYGILFSVLFMGSMFVYITRKCLRRGHIVDWIGICLIFAEMNTYNAMALCNQDVSWIGAAFFMLALNAVCMSEDPGINKELPEVTGSGLKKILVHIICCS